MEDSNKQPKDPTKTPAAGHHKSDFSLAAAAAKCERLLAYRERSSAEIKQRLLRDGFAESISQTMMERLIQSGLVDDDRFARLFIDAKRRQGWGQRRISQALQQLGIQAEGFAEQFAVLQDDAVELARAQSALQHYHGRSRDPYSGRYRFLLSRGYTPGIISQALAVWRADCEDQDNSN
ncbi:MAG: recombination regulator RecX [Actinomycetia bacterium]|nr:recombination regulator RecX [Actinomycetes bacterium]